MCCFTLYYEFTLSRILVVGIYVSSFENAFLLETLLLLQDTSGLLSAGEHSFYAVPSLVFYIKCIGKPQTQNHVVRAGLVL